MVGASGFEPPTSWSRTNHVNPITLYLGVAYGTRSVISPLLAVPNLYTAQETHILQAKRLPSRTKILKLCWASLTGSVSRNRGLSCTELIPSRKAL